MRQCVEVSKYGLLFAARQFALISWAGKLGQREQLCFSDLLHTLLELTAGAGRFYNARGYHGSLLIHAALHHVRAQAMRFVPATSPIFPEVRMNFAAKERFYARQGHVLLGAVPMISYFRINASPEF